MNRPLFDREATRLQEALRGDHEAERRRNHHDVLCLVLKEQWRALMNSHTEKKIDVEATSKRFDDIAKHAADLAYPPPKEQA